MVDGNFFDKALTARCHVKRLFEHAFFLCDGSFPSVIVY